MKLTVPTRNAMLLGNGLIDHAQKLQLYQKTKGGLPKDRYTTYTKLIEETGATVIPQGIGHQLDHVMDALHAAGVPEKMRGLTLFVTDAAGAINYSGDHWYDITSLNSMQFRKAVLEQDWKNVTFILTDAEG